MDYALLKLVHLLAVVLWIGPPLGAYYILFAAHRDSGGDGAADRILFAERAAERVLLFEHIALVILVVSGGLLVFIGPWQLFGTPWLAKKMILFAGVLLFEVFDIWLAHVVFARLLKAGTVTGAEFARADKKRRVLAGFGGIVFFGLIPAMFYLAIVKA